MKKTLASDYALYGSYYGNGETYRTILNYFYPELITSLILYFALNFIDSWFISQINISYYATLGVTNTLLHFLTKIAEGFSIGVVVLCGQFNGIGEYKKVGNSVVDAFWTTCIFGGIIAIFLYFFAPTIYSFYAIPESMIKAGIPFLRLRAFGIFFTFIFFALIGFLRGIKNTKVPMYLFLIGGAVFIFFDYILIFGKFGFNSLGFQGSAIAYILQYVVMSVGVLVYIIFDSEVRKYCVNLFCRIHLSNIYKLFNVSWPIMLDKASIAVCHIWLARMVAHMTNFESSDSAELLLASFTAIKDMERFAILPGGAIAQVITFLVSNDFKLQNWDGIKTNVKKVILIASAIFLGIIFIFSFYSKFFVRIVDKNGNFGDFVSRLIPIISVLIFFDLIQLILSAALRGTANVKIVMWVRFIVGLFCFMPISYVFTIAPLKSLFFKFVLIYGSFYLSNALMICIYFYHYKSDTWKNGYL